LKNRAGAAALKADKIAGTAAAPVFLRCAGEEEGKEWAQNRILRFWAQAFSFF